MDFFRELFLRGESPQKISDGASDETRHSPVEQLWLIPIALTLGFFARRYPLFPENAHTAINAFIITISVPATILQKIPSLTFSPELALIAAMPWIILAGAAIFFIVLGRLLKWPGETVWSLVLVAGLGNTSFVGFPVLMAFYGPDSIAYGVVADQLGTFLALATIGSLIVATKSPVQQNIHPVRRLLTFPPFLALLAAFAMRLGGLQLPDSITAPFAATLTPLALFATGFQLRFSKIENNAAPLAAGLFWKLAAAPAIVAFSYAPFLSNAGLPYKVSVLEAGMGPMITAGLLAVSSGLNPRLAGLMIGIGTPLSLISTYVWQLWL